MYFREPGRRFGERWRRTTRHCRRSGLPGRRRGPTVSKVAAQATSPIARLTFRRPALSNVWISMVDVLIAATRRASRTHSCYRTRSPPTARISIGRPHGASRSRSAASPSHALDTAATLCPFTDKRVDPAHPLAYREKGRGSTRLVGRWRRCADRPRRDRARVAAVAARPCKPVRADGIPRKSSATSSLRLRLPVSMPAPVVL